MSSHNTLGNGEWLKVGQSLWSEDGSVEFKMQGDGKIAVYWGGQCQFQNTKEQRQDIKVSRCRKMATWSSSRFPILHSSCSSALVAYNSWTVPSLKLTRLCAVTTMVQPSGTPIRPAPRVTALSSAPCRTMAMSSFTRALPSGPVAPTRARFSLGTITT